MDPPSKDNEEADNSTSSQFTAVYKKIWDMYLAPKDDNKTDNPKSF